MCIVFNVVDMFEFLAKLWEVFSRVAAAFNMLQNTQITFLQK